VSFLLDTNAISMFSPSKASASDAFADWLNEQDQLDAIYLSVVTIHEIEKGVRLLEVKGAKAKADQGDDEETLCQISPPS
jgi:predicted nucleic acid-binding protein